MGIEKIFKSEILNSGGYKGGKAIVTTEKDKKIHKLSSNENVYGFTPSLQQTLASRASGLNIYPPSTPELLYEALTAHYQGQLTADQFIAGNGGSELLQLITWAFLDSNTNCIISNPCFAPYRMFSSWTGASVIDVPLIGDQYRLDVKGILSSINQQTRLIFLTSPNNPTGTYIRKQELDTLVQEVPDHVVIIYDEVYHHFVDVADYTRAIHYVNEGIPIIAINSFSKAYGLAGLRIGYGYSTPQITRYIRKLIRPFLIDDMSLNAAISVLQDQNFIQDTAAKIRAEKEKLYEGLQSLGIKYWHSQANFVLIKTALDENILTDKMQELSVMVRPSGNFGAPGCVRITVGNEEATQATLSALATILGK